MPNTTAEKDYTQYSEKQLFNLMNKKEQELEKLKGIGRILKRKWLKNWKKGIKTLRIK